MRDVGVKHSRHPEGRFPAPVAGVSAVDVSSWLTKACPHIPIGCHLTEVCEALGENGTGLTGGWLVQC